MNAFTYFSTHAYKRIKQRSLLSFDEITSILDGKFYVHTGTQPGFNREHLLFYSHKDDCCFVAIRDNQTGKVITVLPLEYHKNLAWPISNKDISKAKEIYPFELLQSHKTIQDDPSPAIRRFYVTLHFIDEQDKRRSTPVITIQSKRQTNESKLLVHDVNLISVVFEKITSLNLNDDQILGITIRTGKRSSFIFFSINEVEEFSNRINLADSDQ